MNIDVACQEMVWILQSGNNHLVTIPTAGVSKNTMTVLELRVCHLIERTELLSQIANLFQACMHQYANCMHMCNFLVTTFYIHRQSNNKNQLDSAETYL